MAQVAADTERAEHHLAEMQRWYRGTQVPSLIERCDRLVKQFKRRVPSNSDVPPEREDAPRTVLEAVRHGGTGSRRAVTLWSLRKILSQLPREEGYVFAPDEGCIAEVGEASSELEAWASERLAAGSSTQRDEGDEGDPGELGDHTVTDHNEIQLGERSYRLLPLRAPRDGEDCLVGVLVLPSECAFQVPATLLRALAGRLSGEREATPAEA